MSLPPPFSENEEYINAIIETPKGCAAKYDYDPGTQMFRLKKVLPQGMVFPFHFGFIPSTKAADGDPLDVLVLLDEPAWPGCIISCILIGVMEATETENGKSNRNDRLIAAAVASDKYNTITDLSYMDEYLQQEIENFFNNYNNLEQKEFKVTGKKGSDVAKELIKKQLIHGNNR